MSFSSNVKSELIRRFGEESDSNMAEMSAIVNLCGQIEQNEDNFCIKIHTKNVGIARKFFTLVKKNFNIECNTNIVRTGQMKKSRFYLLSIDEEKHKSAFEQIAQMCFKKDDVKYNAHIWDGVYSTLEARMAYIRGVFLAAGSITEPEKTYHLEIVCLDFSYCEKLRQLLEEVGINAGYILRKEHHVLYIKDGEGISDFLNAVGAHVSLMEYENIRIIKDMRNNVNRIVNCETANLSKTIAASVKQIEDINFIKDNFGLDYLDKPLMEAAEVRMSYPELSLKELGKMLDPPVGKSGMNHRLHKISEIAEQLMEGMEKKND